MARGSHVEGATWEPRGRCATWEPRGRGATWEPRERYHVRATRVRCATCDRKLSGVACLCICPPC
eukprot:73195-Prymnesium_polylepis.1